MSILSPKEEMQQIIQKLVATNDFQAVADSLNIYIQTFGVDSFSLSVYNPLAPIAPLVSLICLNVPDDYIDTFLSEQTYCNLEVVRTSSSDSFADIINYINTTNSKYICFLEANQRYDSTKIANMVLTMEQKNNLDLCITPRNFINSQGTIIAPPDCKYRNALQNTVFNGRTFLQYNVSEHVNLYGNLSTIMVSTSYAQQIAWDIPSYTNDTINRLSMLYQFLLYGSIAFTNEAYVSTYLGNYNDDLILRDEYITYVNYLAHQNLITLEPTWNQTQQLRPYTSVPKEITFFYTDKGEFYNLKPIADEAKKRGYSTRFTEDIKETAEIGIYCQHVCFPENSKFSVILLHDMAQGHNRWPNLWELERWDKFDLGVLPGRFWSDLWSQCACQYYANPRCGTYELGYPKSDFINSSSLKDRVAELRQTMNMKYNFSVLYAPSWENDEKEDDFVRALASLNVNLLIKQAHWPKTYQHIIDNIEEMRALHEGKYENVYYIEPEESIMTALALCDVVVSDESSVMAEAVMFGKPSVAVTDWLIPDCTPSRFASVPMDYVLKCKKVELREYIENLSTNKTCYDSILQKGKLLFSNQGSCCKDILDAIEYYTNQGTSCDFLSKKVESKYSPCSMWR